MSWIFPSPKTSIFITQDYKFDVQNHPRNLLLEKLFFSTLFDISYLSDTMRYHMVHIGAVWYHYAAIIVPYGTIMLPLCYHMVPLCYHMVPYGTIWYHYATICYHYATIWYHYATIPNGTIMVPLVA